jgi:hypothetical protein
MDILKHRMPLLRIVLDILLHLLVVPLSFGLLLCKLGLQFFIPTLKYKEKVYHYVKNWLL